MSCLLHCLYITKRQTQKKGRRKYRFIDSTHTKFIYFSTLSISRSILLHYRRVTSTNWTRDCRAANFNLLRKCILCLHARVCAFETGLKRSAVLIRVYGQAIILLINESHSDSYFIICCLWNCMVLAMRPSFFLRSLAFLFDLAFECFTFRDQEIIAFFPQQINAHSNQTDKTKSMLSHVLLIIPT